MAAFSTTGSFDQVHPFGSAAITRLLDTLGTSSALPASALVRRLQAAASPRL
jgi:hypothetical protein